MSRSLLDTNIISNVTKPVPSEALAAWMSGQADKDLFISSLRVAEIRRGILEKPAGKKRGELERWFAGPEGPQALFAGRVLPFDAKAGKVCMVRDCASVYARYFPFGERAYVITGFSGAFAVTRCGKGISLIP